MGDRKWERNRGCMILSGTVRAWGAETLLEVSVCSGILGFPCAVCDDGTASTSTWSRSCLTSTVVGSWPLRTYLEKARTFLSSGTGRMNDGIA